MAKYYSVFKGKSGKPKIFTTWDECKAEVIGCKGAIYKSFKTMDEAITFAIQFTFVNNNISLEKIESLNAEIEKGWQDMEAGRGRNSKEVFQDLRKRYA